MTYTPLEREDGTQLSVHAETLLYEKLDHFCFGVLCSVDHDGFLRERTPDDNYPDASDHRD